MGLRCSLLLLFAIAFLPSCIVPTKFSEPGPYVGASFAYAWDDFDDLDPTESNDDDSVAGFGARVGYRIIDWVAAEIAYDRFDDFDVKVADVDLQALTLQGKVYPFLGRFQPYGLVGIGIVNGDVHPGDDDNDTLLRFGGGIDIYIIRHLAAFAEVTYSAPQDDLDDLDYWNAQVGALFRF